MESAWSRCLAWRWRSAVRGNKSLKRPFGHMCLQNGLPCDWINPKLWGSECLYNLWSLRLPNSQLAYASQGSTQKSRMCRRYRLRYLLQGTGLHVGEWLPRRRAAWQGFKKAAKLSGTSKALSAGTFSFVFRERQLRPLGLSADSIWPNLIIVDALPYSKSTDFRCQLHLQNTFTANRITEMEIKTQLEM